MSKTQTLNDLLDAMTNESHQNSDGSYSHLPTFGKKTDLVEHMILRSCDEADIVSWDTTGPEASHRFLVRTLNAGVSSFEIVGTDAAMSLFGYEKPLNFVIEYAAPPANERFIETTVGDQLTDLRILANPTNEMYESPNCDSDAEAARAVLEASEAWGLKHFGDQERGVEMPIVRADDEDGAYWAWVR